MLRTWSHSHVQLYISDKVNNANETRNDPHSRLAA